MRQCILASIIDTRKYAASSIYKHTINLFKKLVIYNSNVYRKIDIVQKDLALCWCGRINLNSSRKSGVNNNYIVTSKDNHSQEKSRQLSQLNALKLKLGTSNFNVGPNFLQ